MSAAPKHRATVFGLTLCLCLISLGLAEAQGTRGADVAVVVNPDTPVENLSLEDVRRIFMGEQQYWNSKLPVVVLLRAPSAREREVVLSVIYEMNEVQYKRYWLAKIFRAEAATAPKIVYSNEMANDMVAALPGAIAVIGLRDVRPGLKVLRVNGHRPGEAGYPLK